MKTSHLIKNLSSEAAADDSHFYATSLATWLTGSLALLTVLFYFLPFRSDLVTRSLSPFFMAETILFFALFVTATRVAYRSAIPALLKPHDRWIAGTLLVLAVVGVATRFSLSGLAAEFAGEMDFYRGRCGPIMLALGAGDAALVMALARRAAPTNARVTGLWVALSAGSLGLFSMQFICNHENFLHLALWHVVPVAILAGAGVAAARRWLRW